MGGDENQTHHLSPGTGLKLQVQLCAGWVGPDTYSSPLTSPPVDMFPYPLQVSVLCLLGCEVQQHSVSILYTQSVKSLAQNFPSQYERQLVLWGREPACVRDGESSYYEAPGNLAALREEKHTIVPNPENAPLWLPNFYKDRHEVRINQAEIKESSPLSQESFHFIYPFLAVVL